MQTLTLLTLVAMVTVHNCTTNRPFFFTPITFQPWCGQQLRHLDDIWTVEARVNLTFNLTDPVYVTFQTTDVTGSTDDAEGSNRTLCRVELVDCEDAMLNVTDYLAVNESSVTMATEVCTCEQRDDEYHLVMRRRARVEESGSHLEAVIIDGNFTNVADIGVLPLVRDEAVSATYCIDSGDFMPLLPSQTVFVCGGDYVGVMICTEESPGIQPVLRLAVNGQTVRANRSCIHMAEKYDFSTAETYPLVFYYDEMGDCPVKENRTIFVQEKEGCADKDIGMLSLDADHTAVDTTAQPDDNNRCRFRAGSPVNPIVFLSSGVEVLCDSETDGGGWVVFQRRNSSSVDFTRDWHDYTVGFGNLRDNFWLGLDYIHRLCNEASPCQLRIDLARRGDHKHAMYDTFFISGPGEFYRLHVKEYTGDAGDALLGSEGNLVQESVLHGMSFTTYDSDHDGYTGNCAQLYNHRGGWWYNNCYMANLNEEWGRIVWYPFSGDHEHLDFSEMKLRQKQ